MKYYSLILLFIPFFGTSQTLPTGCIKQINVPAEYTKEVMYIDVPAVTYVKPILTKITKEVIIKEKAIENYYECAIDGTLKQCSRIVPEQRETITYEVVSGYETITVVQGQTIKKEKLTKVKDGYVATVPCDFIIK